MMKNKRYSVVDLILIDHRFLKDSIRFLVDDRTGPSDRLAEARRFLNLLKMHCSAKVRTVYGDLKNEEEFSQEIMDGQIRHHRVAERLRAISAKIIDIHWITDELSEALKSLAGGVLEYLENEERNLLGLMNEHLSELYLCDLGIRYEKARKFTTQELETLPSFPERISEKVEQHLNTHS